MDSFAETLLAELGVTETYMETLAHNLAANTTKKKRKGFVQAEKLAKNWAPPSWPSALWRADFCVVS